MKTDNHDRQSFPSHGECFVLLAVVLLLLGLLLGGCAHPPRSFTDAKPIATEALLGPRPVTTAMLALSGGEDAATPVRGSFRELHGRTSGVSSTTYNPGIRWPLQEPKVGQTVSVDWSTTACTSPAPPGRAMSLLVSLRPMAAPIAGQGGYWLMVNPDFVLLPAAGSMLTQVGGKLLLRWVPTPDWSGRSVWVQCLIHAPGEVPAYQVTPAVEISVGSAL